MDTLPHLQFHDHPAVPLRIDFHLHEHGWASLALVAGESEVTIGTFAYSTDALGDLIRCAIAIATGAVSTQMILDGEPLLWGISVRDGWQSTRTPAALRLLVKSDMPRFDEQYYPENIPIDSWSELLLEQFVTADSFAQAVSAAAHAVLDAFGERGYLDRWQSYRFPKRALAALDAALLLPFEDNRRGTSGIEH